MGSVKQGLSSSLFTKDVKNVFHWYLDCLIYLGLDQMEVIVELSIVIFQPMVLKLEVHLGMVCFYMGRGEKETGGGRESGSDSWKVR